MLMPKILIVDDSETLRTQVRQILQEAGYQVIEGVDGLSGLEVLQENPDTHLIICDVNMPKMDGLTMCQRIHENQNLNKIPIFMMTTEANPDIKQRGKAAGVVAWVTKPFVEVKLMSAIKKVLGV